MVIIKINWIFYMLLVQLIHYIHAYMVGEQEMIILMLCILIKKKEVSGELHLIIVP